MTWATITREVARLDAISRTRDLNEGEEIQLEKLIRMEQRYARTAEKRTAAHAPPLADAPIVATVRGRPRPPVGARVRFSVQTGAGWRTYEAEVAGYRANRGGPAGWVETVDDAGFRRSVQPARCEVCG